MSKYSLYAILISSFMTTAVQAEIVEEYVLPIEVYTPPLNKLRLPQTEPLPTQIKSGFDPLIQRQSVKFNDFSDITEKRVEAFKEKFVSDEMISKILTRTPFEVDLVGEANLRSLPPIWIFNSELSWNDELDVIAKKIARLAMTATNSYLHNIDQSEKRQLISDLYVRAGHVMSYAAAGSSDPKTKRDYYLSAAQYFYWSLKRMDDPDLKIEVRKLSRDVLMLANQVL